MFSFLHFILFNLIKTRFYIFTRHTKIVSMVIATSLYHISLISCICFTNYRDIKSSLFPHISYSLLPATQCLELAHRHFIVGNVTRWFELNYIKMKYDERSWMKKNCFFRDSSWESGSLKDTSARQSMAVETKKKELKFPQNENNKNFCWQ